jgi:ATP sulfurylase
MRPKTKAFDAMAESRKWKEVVAHFDRDAVHRRFQSVLERSGRKKTGSASKA